MDQPTSRAQGETAATVTLSADQALIFYEWLAFGAYDDDEVLHLLSVDVARQLATQVGDEADDDFSERASAAYGRLRARLAEQRRGGAV